MTDSPTPEAAPLTDEQMQCCGDYLMQAVRCLYVGDNDPVARDIQAAAHAVVQALAQKDAEIEALKATAFIDQQIHDSVMEVLTGTKDAYDVACAEIERLKAQHSSYVSGHIGQVNDLLRQRSTLQDEVSTIVEMLEWFDRDEPVSNRVRRLASDVERLNAENAELRNGLLKFGRHTYACTANWCTECQHHVSDIRAEVTGCKMSRHYPRPCNCGLAALQSAQKEK